MTTKHKKFVYLIIFGAAVKINGKPSGAMKRRVKSAVLGATNLQNVHFLVTGGTGLGKSVSEAEAMKKLLIRYNVPEKRITIEDKGHDTLSSVNFCSTILHNKNDFETVFVCSDRYHIPRCRWLLFIFGISTQPLPVISGKEANGALKWMYYYIRDYVALPYDTLLALVHKIKNRE